MVTTTSIQAPLASSLIGQHSANVDVLKNNTLHMRSKSLGFAPASRRRFVVVASKSIKEANFKSDDQDDLSFLLKLGAGSVAGAAAIKYGSILVPDITRPNIIQALVMISTPVIVAVFILIKQSRVER